MLCSSLPPQQKNPSLALVQQQHHKLHSIRANTVTTQGNEIPNTDKEGTSNKQLSNADEMRVSCGHHLKKRNTAGNVYYRAARDIYSETHPEVGCRFWQHQRMTAYDRAPVPLPSEPLVGI